VGRMFLFPVLALLLGLPWALVGLPGLLGSHLPLLAGSLLAGWILLGREGRSPAALGFHAGREAAREAGWGLLAGAVLVGGVVVAMTAAGGIRWSLEPGGVGGVGRAALWALVVLAIPAAAEEALLRGYIFQSSAREWGWGVTLGWTSVAFALLHGGNPALGRVALANLALAGVVLGLLVLRTGSLWWATGAHLGWNWGQVALDLPVSGLDLVDVPLLAPVTTGPDWLAGGGFGVEGSILATLALTAGSVWLWRGGGAGWIRPVEGVEVAGSPVLEGRAGAERLRRLAGDGSGVASPMVESDRDAHWRGQG
jgi:membrane protease YdiL (CAAX protease family)